MNVRKYQSGGTSTQFAIWTPIPSMSNTDVQMTDPPFAQDSSSKAQVKIEDLLPKDILKELVSKGLPNDVDMTLSAINDILIKYDTTVIGEEPSIAEMSRDYLQILSLVNKVSFNKEKWNDIAQSLESNDSFGEVAVTRSGHAVAKDREGKIMLVTPQQIYNNKNLSLVTNGELMSLRSRNMSMAFDYDVFEQIDENVSPKGIREWIYSYANQAQSSSSSISGDALMTGQTGQFNQILSSTLTLLNDPRVTQEAMGLPGNYYMASREISSNAQQLQNQLQLIYSMMPENYKKYLNIKAAASGLDPKTGYIQILGNVISGVTKTSEDIAFKPAQLPGLDSGGSSKSSGNLSEDASYIDRLMVNGRREFKFMAPQGNNTIISAGWGDSTIVDHNFRAVTSMGWQSAVVSSVLGTISNPSEAFVLAKDNQGNVYNQKLGDMVNDIELANQEWGVLELPVRADGTIDNDVYEKGSELIQVFYENRDQLVRANPGTNAYELTESGVRYLDAVAATGVDYLQLDNKTGSLIFDPRRTKQFVAVNANLGVDEKRPFGWDWMFLLGTDPKFVQSSGQFMKESEYYDRKSRRQDFKDRLHGKDSNVEYDKIMSTVVYIPLKDVESLNILSNRYFDTDVEKVGKESFESRVASSIAAQEQQNYRGSERTIDRSNISSLDI